MEGKRNIIYVVMILAIIISFLYRHESNKETVILNDGVDLEQNENSGENIGFFTYYYNTFKTGLNDFRKSSYYRYVLLGMVCLVLGGFIWGVSKGKISFAKEQEKKAKIQNEKVFAEPIKSVNQYEMITKETTQKEVEKLFSSEKFKKMAEEKGEKVENWNWQSREKSKRTVFRDDKSDTSDEHMSQVDFSDND